MQEFAEVVGGFSPFSWENQTWRNFFANVDYHTAAVSQRCSMIELACYIRFAEKNPHDLGAWYRLTEDEMRAYKVPHVEKFLRYELAWQKQIEEFVPEIRNTRDGLMDDMPDEMQKVGKAFAEWLAVGRVEDSLLDPYEWQAVSLGKMMSYGQVFHACAAACHRVWGDQWPLKIAVFNGLSEQHDDRLAMHMKAHIICALLYTDSHWACLFYKRGDPKAFVADGLKKPEIMDAARAALLHISWTSWFGSSSSSQPPSVEWMQVPSQGDGWSCGHRVILCLLFVLNACKKIGQMPQSIPDHKLSEKSIEDLVDAMTEMAAHGAEPGLKEAEDNQQKRAVAEEPPEVESGSPPRKSRRVSDPADEGMPGDKDPCTPVPKQEEVSGTSR